MNKRTEDSKEIFEFSLILAGELYEDYVECRGEFSAEEIAEDCPDLVLGDIYDLVVNEVRFNIRKCDQEDIEYAEEEEFECFSGANPGDYIYEEEGRLISYNFIKSWIKPKYQNDESVDWFDRRKWVAAVEIMELMTSLNADEQLPNEVGDAEESVMSDWELESKK